LARPLTYDSSIHYNLPVYPGALRQSRLDATGLFRGDKYDECQVVVS
jgi:hypothetical protein